MSLLVGANRRKLSWLDIAVPTFSQSINVQRYGAELIKKLVKSVLALNSIIVRSSTNMPDMRISLMKGETIPRDIKGRRIICCFCNDKGTWDTKTLEKFAKRFPEAKSGTYISCQNSFGIPVRFYSVRAITRTRLWRL